MAEGGPNERWGVRKTPLPTCVRVKKLPRTRDATHTLTEVHFLSVYFFSVYTCSFVGSFGAFSATLWGPMGQSPSKTKALPTWHVRVNHFLVDKAEAHKKPQLMRHGLQVESFIPSREGIILNYSLALG